MADSARERAITSMGDRYTSWCTDRNLNPVLLVACRSLLAFLVYRCNELNGSTKTLGGTVSMIKSFSSRSRQPWLDAQELILIDKLIKHLQYKDVTPTRRVTPLTLDILEDIVASPDVSSQIKTMFMTGHDCLNRAGEICSGLTSRDFQWSRNQKRVTIEYPRSKCNRAGGSEFITMEDYSTNSGARLLRRHFRKYDLFRSPHLIVFPALIKDQADWSRPMATSQFRIELKRAVKSIGLDSKRFAGHSLRAGGATDLFNANVPYPIIKKMGRWRSDAAMIYYRDEDAVTKATTKGFASLASRPRHGLEQYHVARPKTK